MKKRTIVLVISAATVLSLLVVYTFHRWHHDRKCDIVALSAYNGLMGKHYDTPMNIVDWDLIKNIPGAKSNKRYVFEMVRAAYDEPIDSVDDIDTATVALVERVHPDCHDWIVERIGS